VIARAQRMARAIDHGELVKVMQRYGRIRSR
jgi:hypothetical protein